MTIQLGPVRLDNIDIIKAVIIPSTTSSVHPRLILELFTKNSDDKEYKGFCTFTTEEMIEIGNKLLNRR